MAQKEAELEQVVKKRKILTKEVSDLKKKTGVDGVGRSNDILSNGVLIITRM